jgi:hypothetical protein
VPERVNRILANLTRRQAVRGREYPHLPALGINQTASPGRDPESAFAVGAEGEDVVAALEGRGIVAIQDTKLLAVEAREAGLRAEPEIAIAGFRDGADGFLRQAVANVPDVEPVLRDGFGGVDSESGRSQGDGREDEEGPGTAPPDRRKCRPRQ